MLRNSVIALAALLTACATTSEPRIEVREVKVAVPVKCDPQPRPVKRALPDTDAALKAAHDARNPDLGVQLLLAGRRLRNGYIGELEAALSGCTGDPPTP